MFSWLKLVHLGDLALTLPAAAAMTASLMASRAWRIAFWWTVLVVAGFGLVAASKIAFMGWGTGWQALCFKALSGHATGVTAIFPFLMFLLLQRHGERARMAGACAGLALGALIAAILVAMREHSPAEAIAGWSVGALVSTTAVRLAASQPPLDPLPSLLSFALAFAAGAWLMQSAHFGYWMIRAARLLSGNERLFPLNFD